MTLWRPELIRTVRTHRWMLVLGVYTFFGAVGPLLARYLEEIVSNFGGEVTLTGVDPRPVDSIGQFVSNGSQLGVLSVVVLAAGALTLDAHPEFAAFLRTKVTNAGSLLLPRFGIATATAVIALWAGTAVAWVTTSAVLGPVPAGSMLLGTVLGSIYLGFAVAVVAAMASIVRSVAAAVFASIAVLLVLPVIALVPPIAPWLPSELLAAVAGLVDGASIGLPAIHDRRPRGDGSVATRRRVPVGTPRTVIYSADPPSPRSSPVGFGHVGASTERRFSHDDRAGLHNSPRRLPLLPRAARRVRWPQWSCSASTRPRRRPPRSRRRSNPTHVACRSSRQ